MDNKSFLNKTLNSQEPSKENILNTNKQSTNVKDINYINYLTENKNKHSNNIGAMI